jgi:hypothetical protein
MALFSYDIPCHRESVADSHNYHDELEPDSNFCWCRAFLPWKNKTLKVHKIEIFFGFDFEICIISLLVMSKF